jgi:hypothetical protein
MLAVGCDEGESADTTNRSPSGATATTPIETPSPADERPPKPRPQAGRLDGRYAVKYTLISSDVPEPERVQQHRWRFEARCRVGGECNARLESTSGDWRATAIWRRGLYRWARSINKAYTCGSGGEIDYYIDGTYEYSIRGRKVRWTGDDWAISRFEGTLTSKGRRGCGLSGPPQQKYAITGKIV